MVLSNKSIGKAIETVSDDFHCVYGKELHDMQICPYLTEVMAKTELDSFNVMSNNCQTPVSKFFYYLQQTTRHIVLPLDLRSLMAKYKQQDKYSVPNGYKNKANRFHHIFQQHFYRYSTPEQYKFMQQA